MPRRSNIQANRSSTKSRFVSRLGRVRGASASRSEWQPGLNAWLANHRFVAVDSFNRLRKALIPSVMTWLVLGIALSLPAALYVSLENLGRFGGQWEGSAQISLFLNKSLANKAGADLADRLKVRSEVEDTRYVSPEQALIEFQQLSGLNNVLDSLTQNPLPAVIVVKPEAGAKAVIVEALFAELRALPEVNQAALDQEWLQRLQSLMTIGGRITAALALLLSLGVLLVIGNTIRLAIEGRRDEILVVKLVGATDAFVRRPFLYTGFWYGLGGGLCAWLIILVGLYWLHGPVQALAGLYNSDFQLVGLGIMDTLSLWLIGALLGLLGAWLAVARHLGDIEPK